jgi:hypothetical protein
MIQRYIVIETGRLFAVEDTFTRQTVYINRAALTTAYRHEAEHCAYHHNSAWQRVVRNP